jgi:hypothetical protein
MYFLIVFDCQIFHYDLDTNMFLTLADRKNTTNQHNQSITTNAPLLMSLSVCTRGTHKLHVHFPFYPLKQPFPARCSSNLLHENYDTLYYIKKKKRFVTHTPNNETHTKKNYILAYKFSRIRNFQQ